MKCGTCDADIPPAWVHCLQTNVCPGCGGQIMNDFQQELLTELKGAMERMPNNPEGLAGWLISNYNMKKIGDAEPTEFYVKKTKENEEPLPPVKIHQEGMGNKAILDKFMARADNGSELMKRQGTSLKEIAKQINSMAVISPEDIDNIEENGIEEEGEPQETIEDLYPGGVPVTALTAIGGKNNVEEQYAEMERMKQMSARQTISSGGRKKGSFNRA